MLSRPIDSLNTMFNHTRTHRSVFHEVTAAMWLLLTAMTIGSTWSCASGPAPIHVADKGTASPAVLSLDVSPIRANPLLVLSLPYKRSDKTDMIEFSRKQGNQHGASLTSEQWWRGLYRGMRRVDGKVDMSMTDDIIDAASTMEIYKSLYCGIELYLELSAGLPPGSVGLDLCGLEPVGSLSSSHQGLLNFTLRVPVAPQRVQHGEWVFPDSIGSLVCLDIDVEGAGSSNDDPNSPGARFRKKWLDSNALFAEFEFVSEGLPKTLPFEVDPARIRAACGATAWPQTGAFAPVWRVIGNLMICGLNAYDLRRGTSGTRDAPGSITSERDMQTDQFVRDFDPQLHRYELTQSFSQSLGRPSSQNAPDRYDERLKFLEKSAAALRSFRHAQDQRFALLLHDGEFGRTMRQLFGLELAAQAARERSARSQMFSAVAGGFTAGLAAGQMVAAASSGKLTPSAAQSGSQAISQAAQLMSRSDAAARELAVHVSKVLTDYVSGVSAEQDSIVLNTANGAISIQATSESGLREQLVVAYEREFGIDRLRVAIEMHDAERLNSIAWSIVRPDSGKVPLPSDLETALLAATKATEFCPDHLEITGRYLDTLARVYFLKGEYSKAFECETKAQAALPSWADAKFAAIVKVRLEEYRQLISN